MVLLSVATIAWSIGIIAISTIYLHWQWYHYTRQSEGISKAYSFKSKTAKAKQTLFDRFVFYLIPAVCFLDTASNGHSLFLGAAVWMIPVSKVITFWLLSASFIIFAIWFTKKTTLLMNKDISIAYFPYLQSHYLFYCLRIY